MDSRNRVLSTLEKRMPDRLPIDLGCPTSSMTEGAYARLIQYLGIKGGQEIIAPDHVILEFDEVVLKKFQVDFRRVFAPWGEERFMIAPAFRGMPGVCSIGWSVSILRLSTFL